MKNYINMLKPDDSSTPDEIKSRYRELVKKNHPDIFPQERRREQNLILMEINEAYLSLLNNSYATAKEYGEIRAESGSLPVVHREPDYVYYRSAIDHLNRGNYIFNWSRYLPVNHRYHFDVRKSSLLKTATEAIECYRLAYSLFLKVCTGYPSSVWVTDSMDKLDLIEKLNERYSEIIERLTGS